MQSYSDYLNDINSSQYNRIEFQADLFAGFILIPPIQLEEIFDKLVSKLKKEKFDLSNIHNKERAMSAIARSIQNNFKVSEAIVFKRLRQDDLSL